MRTFFSAITLIGGLVLAGATAQAQLNTLELRGVDGESLELALTPVLVAIAVPAAREHRVVFDERRSQADGSIYTEARIAVTDAEGATSILSAEATLSAGPNGIDAVVELRVDGGRLEADLTLTTTLGPVINVFVGLSNRETFLVLAEGQVLGRVRLTREDRDRDGIDDAVRVEFTDAATQAVYEKYYDWSLYQN